MSQVRQSIMAGTGQARSPRYRKDVMSHERWLEREGRPAACGIGDVGLVLAAIDKVTNLDAQFWFDAWTAAAVNLEARGRGRGRQAPAHGALGVPGRVGVLHHGAGARQRDGRPVRAAADLQEGPRGLGEGRRRVAGRVRPGRGPYEDASCPGTCCARTPENIGFSQAQGANFHCQPDGRQLTHTQMLDWLADHLPARG